MVMPKRLSLLASRFPIPLAAETRRPGFLGVIRCQNGPCIDVNPSSCTSKRKSNTTNSTNSPLIAIASNLNPSHCLLCHDALGNHN